MHEQTGRIIQVDYGREIPPGYVRLPEHLEGDLQTLLAEQGARVDVVRLPRLGIYAVNGVNLYSMLEALPDSLRQWVEGRKAKARSLRAKERDEAKKRKAKRKRAHVQHKRNRRRR